MPGRHATCAGPEASVYRSSMRLTVLRRLGTSVSSNTSVRSARNAAPASAFMPVALNKEKKKKKKKEKKEKRRGEV